MQAVSDEQLIQWVAAGDRSCLGTLFERHYRGVYRFCLQMTRNRATSEDLAQETFLKMMKSAKTYRGQGSFKAWMFNIARNLTYDHLRRQKRRELTPAQDEAVQELVDARSAERTAAGEEMLLQLVQALSGLSDSAREIIWLGRFEFSGYDDLGKALGCSAGAARVRMHRAMKDLNDTYTSINGAPIDA